MLDSSEERQLAELELVLRLEDPGLDRLLRRGPREPRSWTARLVVASWLSWSACIILVAVIGRIGLTLLVLPAACLTSLGYTTLRHHRRSRSRGVSGIGGP